MSTMREVVAGKLAAGIGIGAAAVAAAAFGGSSRAGPAPQQEQFIQDQPTVQDVSHPPPTMFQMESLLGDMQGLELGSKQAPLQGPVITDFALQQDWAQEFLKNEQNVRISGAAWAGDYFSAELDPVWNDTVGNDLPHLNREIIQHHGLQQTAADLLDDSKWVGQYSDSPPALIGGKTELMTTADDLLHSVTDPSIKATEFMTYVEKLSSGQNTTTGLDLADTWADEYDFQFGTSSGNSDWAQEFAAQGDLGGAQSASRHEFWQNLQTEWDRLAQEEAEQHPWLKNDSSSAVEQAYKFNESNPFQDLSDPLQEGKRRLLQGDIPSAVLAFESAAQQNPENPEAWHLLGTTQAQNEQDPLAISAFNKCLQLQPDNLSALMALAASLTNESYQLQASNALKQWMTVNPKYKQLVPPEVTGPDQVPNITSFLSSKELNTVQKLFMDAARQNPTTGVDPDVQSGLGILFNLGNDYEKAADCFKAALGVKPHDSLLWNRLGATLANGGLSAEAISAYRRALELSPGFIRTRYNLGISCINLNAYKEAAEHFLSSLNQQASGRGLETNSKSNVMSDSIWSSLRMVLHLMDRADLTPLADARNLTQLNKEFNIV